MNNDTVAAGKIAFSRRNYSGLQDMCIIDATPRHHPIIIMTTRGSPCHGFFRATSNNTQMQYQ
jgi:hypothetical protein